MSLAHRLPKLTAACAALALAAVAAPLAHADHLAAGRDAGGDAADPNHGRDLTAVALSYDRRTGTIRGGVALRGAPGPGADAFLSIFAGVRSPGGCDGYPAIGVSSFTAQPVAQWTRFDAAGPAAAAGDAGKEGTGTVLQTFEASSRALAGRYVDCLTAVLADPANPAAVYDSAGPFAFETQPELAAHLGRSPTLRPGETRTVRLTLRNPGDASTGRIRLSVRRARGLRASIPRATRALRAGQRRTVRIRVSLSGRARAATPLRVTASAGKLRVRTKATLHLRTPRGGGDGGGGGSGTCVSYAPVFGGIGDIVTYPC